MSIKLFCQNIRGLRSKIYEIYLLLKTHHPDIIALQETYLSDKNKLIIPGYKIFKSVRNRNPRGGGVAIIAKEDLEPYLIDNSNLTGFENTEFVTISVRFRNSTRLNVTSVYIPPSKQIIHNELQTIFSNNVSIVMGDFNCRHISLGSKKTDSRGVKLMEYVDNSSFAQISLPSHTHLWNRAGIMEEDTIDHVFTSLDIIVSKTHTITDIPSDHRGIMIEIMSSIKRMPLIRKIKLRSKIDWSKIEGELEEIIHRLGEKVDKIVIGDQTSISIDKIAETLSDEIRTKIDLNTPEIEIKGFTEKIPRSILNLIKDKRRLRRKYISSREKSLKSEINRLTKRIKRELNNIRQANMEKTLQKWEAEGNKRNWGDLKKLIRITKSDNDIGPLMVDNKNVTDPKEKIKIFRNKMMQIFSKHPEKFNTNNNPFFVEMLEKQLCKMAKGKNELKNIDWVTSHELSKYIGELHANKAPGHDNIGNLAIKNLKNLLIPFLVKFFNLLFNKSSFPKTWKIAIMTMLHKPGKKKSDPLSYRPLSLTPTLGKLFEKCITTRFNKWLKERNLLNEEQYGFRKFRNTYGGLFKLTQTIRTAFCKGKNVQAVFLDVEKAFDQVWIEGLQNKLIMYGCPDYLRYLILNFAINRKISIKLDGLYSLPFMPIQGVPQGSPLSPIIFAFYVSDIPKPPADILLSQFADDIALWRTEIKNESNSTNRLNKYLNRLIIWCFKWHMGLNARKSKAITFYKRNSTKPIHTEDLKLLGEIIERCSEVKFLGVLFDEHCTFENHINEIMARISPIWQELIILSKLKVETKNLIRIYKVFGRSKIEYASPILICASKKAKSKLLVLENKIIKTCLGVPRYSSNEDARKAAFITPIDERMLDLATTWFKKSIKLNEDFKKFVDNSSVTVDSPISWLTDV